MTISFKISEPTKEKMIEYFKNKKRSKTPPYAIFQADEADTVVTLYEPGKVLFQGRSADIDAELWKQTEKNLNPNASFDEPKKEKSKNNNDYLNKTYYYCSSIGSDEVGTGDFFGPIVVSSAYVTKENIPFLEELGVKDSKKLTDIKILDIVPKIIKKIPYKSFILSNEQYNEKYSENINLNKIKAILHNKVLLSLTKEYPNTDYVIIDEFATKYVYFSYLKDAKEVYKNLIFMTKAEDKNLAVACASLISRYIFLKEFDKLGQNYNLFLPKGASNQATDIGIKIAKIYGIDELKKCAKINFKNYNKIIENIKLPDSK